MSFGLMNAVATFQHLINDVFCEFFDDFVVCSLYNILVYSKNTRKYELHV